MVSAGPVCVEADTPFKPSALTIAVLTCTTQLVYHIRESDSHMAPWFLCAVAAAPRHAAQSLSPATGTASLPVDWWPCKNGNLNHTGYSADAVGLPTELSAGPTWTWQSEVADDILRATPLIDAEHNVYAATVTSGHIIKLSPQGTELWRWRAGEQIPAGPVLMDGMVVTTMGNGSVVALEMATGLPRWRTELHDAAPMDTTSNSAGFGTIITSSVGGAGLGEKRVIALDANGARRWELQLPDAPGLVNGAAYNILVALVRCPAHGESAIFSDSVGDVYKVRLATGELIWRVDGPRQNGTILGGMSTGGAIVGPDGTIYVTTNVGLGGLPMEIGAGTEGVMSVVRGHSHGIVSAHELSTGAVKWRADLGEDNVANNAPSIGPLQGADSPLRVVVTVGPNPTQASSATPATGTTGPAEAAKTIALDAATGGVVWEYEMPVWHGPTAGDSTTHICLPDSSANVAIGSDGAVYVPHEDGVLYALRDVNADGNISDDEVQTYDLGSGFQAAPALAPGMLVVASCAGRVAAWV